ncbi:MAG TPA: bile acid:sodium symporter family protein [Alphaproteobacteria bacterium]
MKSLFLREWYSLAIMGMVVLAAVLPIDGEAAHWFLWATNVAVALLFFVHGARLSRDVVIAGLTHWRLHLFVLATTFVLFPLLGLLMLALPEHLLGAGIATGLLFLCLLPSTVQSSIAFTSIAGGNVSAAVCAASTSNILGMFITPLMAGALFHATGQTGGFSLDAVEGILLQLLAPFLLGQLVQPFIGGWLTRRKTLTQVIDRGSILMIVYGAFSDAVIAGLWTKLSIGMLATITLVDMALLGVVLCFTYYGSAWLGFNRADQITITFCGSKKSLATGMPMARAIFAPPDVGSIVLPLMIFHQVQLMVCAYLARRFAASHDERPTSISSAPGSR